MMGWFNYYRSRFPLDWPYDATGCDEPVEVDWRIQLGVAVAGLILTGLLIALTEWVGG